MAGNGGASVVFVAAAAMLPSGSAFAPASANTGAPAAAALPSDADAPPADGAGPAATLAIRWTTNTSGFVLKKYSSYEQAMSAFNTTINSMPSSKPFSSLPVTKNGETVSPISYKNMIILFLCALVDVMWMRLNRCNSC